MRLGIGKKKTRDELIAEAAELNEQEAPEERKDEVSTGNQKIDIELTKVKGRIEGLDEVRKASSERFSRISEQIGELRGMIVDTNKAMSKVEVSSTKAVDLVESVHPEKLMIEVRRQDGKIESLRAAIESNEAIMKDLMLELKKMRDKMSFYKGTEQVLALNDEVKQELANIKKQEATIGRHADKVETIFLEVQKKFTDFDQFDSVVKDLDKSFKRIASDFEKVRTKTEMKLDKKEYLDLLNRFNEFEKHTTNLLKLLDERNKTVKEEVQADFKKLVNQYRKKLDRMRPPKKPVPVKAEETETGDSGEDMAGGDVRPGMMSKLKGMFGKKEVEPQEEEVEIFKDPPEEPEAQSPDMPPQEISQHPQEAAQSSPAEPEERPGGRFEKKSRWKS